MVDSIFKEFDRLGVIEKGYMNGLRIKSYMNDYVDLFGKCNFLNCIFYMQNKII